MANSASPLLRRSAAILLRVYFLLNFSALPSNFYTNFLRE